MPYNKVNELNVISEFYYIFNLPLISNAYYLNNFSLIYYINNIPQSGDIA